MAIKVGVREMLSADRISERIRWIGSSITDDYRDKHITVVTILKGSFVFAADLVRQIKSHDLSTDFLGVSSYDGGTSSTGVVRITHDLAQPIEGKHVLLVEDIVDTGLTIHHLMDLLQTRNPASIAVCSLLHKPARQKVPVKIDYLGFTIEDKFVVGYGLDYQEKYRNLPYIGELVT